MRNVTCTAYGPFDNGYICVGVEDGSLIGFTDNLDIVFNLKLFKLSVTSIVFEQTNLIIASCEKTN